MTQDNERVRLAKEVIARLDAGTLKPADGVYFENPAKCFTPLDGACRVCAAAALTVACCGWDELMDQTNGDSFRAPSAIAKCLKEIFPIDQLALIEAAYEGSMDLPLADMAASIDRERLRAAAESIDCRDDDWDQGDLTIREREERMREVMTNIIANDGEFRP